MLIKYPYEFDLVNFDRRWQYGSNKRLRIVLGSSCAAEQNEKCILLNRSFFIWYAFLLRKEGRGERWRQLKRTCEDSKIKTRPFCVGRRLIVSILVLNLAARGSNHLWKQARGECHLIFAGLNGDGTPRFGYKDILAKKSRTQGAFYESLKNVLGSHIFRRACITMTIILLRIHAIWLTFCNYSDSIPVIIRDCSALLETDCKSKVFWPSWHALLPVFSYVGCFPLLLDIFLVRKEFRTW